MFQMCLVPYPCQPYSSIPCTVSCPLSQASLPAASHSACWSLAPPSVNLPIHLCISPVGARDIAVGCPCPIMELAPPVPFPQGLLPDWYCCTTQDDIPHTYSRTLQCVKWQCIRCLFLGHGKIIMFFSGRPWHFLFNCMSKLIFVFYAQDYIFILSKGFNQRW